MQINKTHKKIIEKTIQPRKLSIAVNGIEYIFSKPKIINNSLIFQLEEIKKYWWGEDGKK